MAYQETGTAITKAITTHLTKSIFSMVITCQIFAPFTFRMPIKTDDKDKISVLEEPYQSEIIAISNAIYDFNPTIIAIEWTPDKQPLVDSLYLQYKEGKFALKRNEVYQLGFRIGKQSNLDKIHCVDDKGRHYENI